MPQNLGLETQRTLPGREAGPAGPGNRHKSGFFLSNFCFSVAFAEKIRYDGR